MRNDLSLRINSGSNRFTTSYCFEEYSKVSGAEVFTGVLLTLLILVTFAVSSLPQCGQIELYFGHFTFIQLGYLAIHSLDLKRITSKTLLP